MKNSRRGILVLIILLAVGFAAVTATLVINGTSIFGANNDDFDVIFTKAIVDGIQNHTLISEDGKSITYTTNALVSKGDESILDFTVRNTSTQYDAEVSIECVGGSNAGTYYEIEKNVADYIPAQTKDVGQVIVKLIKNSTEPIEEEFTCTITANAVERETEAELVVAQTEITWEDTDDSGDRSIGDLVTISNDDASTEEFYIVSLDDDSVNLLTKYNLYVGGTYNKNTKEWTAYENPSGIQDSQMIGSINTTSLYHGITPFSSDEQKGENYNDYTGSIVEGYVNNYVEYLKDYLGIEATGRLLENTEYSGTGATDTSYWTQTKGYKEYICLHECDGDIIDDTFLIYTKLTPGSIVEGTYVSCTSGVPCYEENTYGSEYASLSYGVRPVVTIATVLFEDEESSEPETQITYEDTDSSGTKNIGDVITLSKEGASSEQFYIISDDGEYLQLMSRYSLYVGGEYTSSWTAYENPTGIQDSTMIGYTSVGTPYKGVTAFSSDEQKGTNYSDYEGSIVEGYVNNYSTYLSNTLEVENTASLITKEELEEIVGQTLNVGTYLNNIGAPAFLYSTSYWTRSAYNTNYVWYVNSNGFFGNDYYSNVDFRGVRPVITISSSLVK